MINKTGNVRVT